MTADADGPLADRLARAITLAGPIPVSRFMAAANAHYYATRASIGQAGDFTTAPEISQMFGELIGAWATDLWDRAGQPAAAFVELGPGRGTLAADALRVMGKAGYRPVVHFIETSSRLRAEQAKRVPDAIWHNDVMTLPDDCPLIVIANEFFDALPIEQIVRATDGWRRRLVACQDTLFLPISGGAVPDTIIPEHLRDSPVGSIVESSPTTIDTIRSLSGKIAAQGGAALIIDYGYEGPLMGETLQAVHGHRFGNPFGSPGEIDLSAHVDFAVMSVAAAQAGVAVHGPTPQRDFLGMLGLATRAAALAKQSPAHADAVAAAYRRLSDTAAMGTLFRALAFTSRNWPEPAGFA